MQAELVITSTPVVSKLYRWYVAFMLFLTYLCEYTDLQIWGPLIPKSEELFGFSMTQTDGFISAVSLGKTIPQLPGGYIADKYGPKFVLVVSMTLMGISTFAMSS
jgi:MFS family permease